MRSGWIKLHRDFLDWEWYGDLKIKSVYLHLMLRAVYDSGGRRCYGYTLRPGQQITTVARLADETNLTVKEVRRALKRLEETGYIETERTNKFTVVSLVNWMVTQAVDNPRANKGQTEDKQKADEGQTEGTLKERKEEGKEIILDNCKKTSIKTDDSVIFEVELEDDLPALEEDPSALGGIDYDPEKPGKSLRQAYETMDKEQFDEWFMKYQMHL